MAKRKKEFDSVEFAAALFELVVCEEADPDRVGDAVEDTVEDTEDAFVRGLGSYLEGTVTTMLSRSVAGK